MSDKHSTPCGSCRYKNDGMCTLHPPQGFVVDQRVSENSGSTKIVIERELIWEYPPALNKCKEWEPTAV